MYKRIGLLGGTFDPIHSQHLMILNSIVAELNLDEGQFLPCYQSVHKDQCLDIRHRLTMLQLAIKNKMFDHLSINLSEVEAQSKRFTVDTMQDLSLPNQQLFFIIGTDSLVQLTSWQRWREILNLCHMIVYPRGKIKNRMSEQLNSYLTDNKQDLAKHHAGKIYLFNTQEQSDISSTTIRTLCQQQQWSEIQQYLPKSILSYIKQHQLYQ